MSNKLHGFIIDPTTAVKNDNGDIVISYADIKFTGKPIVLVTPFSPTGRVDFIPTVIHVGDTHIIIRDKNNIPGYKLNVALADPNMDPYQTGMYANSVLKDKPGEFVIKYPWRIASGNYPHMFLTPYWKESAGYVGRIETLSSTTGSKTEENGVKYNSFLTYSGNTSSNYYVNHLVTLGNNENRMAGAARKGPDSLNQNTVKFPKAWNHTPCLILTPYITHRGQDRKHPEVVKQISNTGFTYDYWNNHDVSKGSYYLNWLAVHRDVPRLSKHSLNSAFDHVFEHFPENKHHFKRFRKELEDIILKGKQPSEELKAFDFEFKIPDHRTRSISTEKEIAIAKVCFDVVALLVNITTGIVSKTTDVAINRLAAEIRNGGEATASVLGETSILVDRAAQNPKQKLDELKLFAQDLKAVSASMVSAGLIKGVLLSIFQDLIHSGWKLAMTILTILAQIGALFLTAGSEIALWLYRIASWLASTGTLYEDAKALQKLNNSNG